MALNANQIKALQAVVPECILCEKDTGVPAELTISQWALESGWNASTPGNNAFGIKDYEGSAGRQLLWTLEWFTESELSKFLEGSQGRTAVFYPAAVGMVNSRARYRCQDWFATFPTLLDCFKKRAELFTTSIYKPFFDEYAKDGNLNTLLTNVASKYATDPRYANQLMAILSMHEVSSALLLGRSSLKT